MDQITIGLLKVNGLEGSASLTLGWKLLVGGCSCGKSNTGAGLVSGNGMENSSNLLVGPMAQWGLNSIAKTNQWSELQGDFGSSPTLYGGIIDNDVTDMPTVDFWP